MPDKDGNWTDKEIYAAALEEWTAIVRKLFVHFGEQPTGELFKIYCDELSEFGIAKLEEIVERAIHEYKYNGLPRINYLLHATIPQKMYQ